MRHILVIEWFNPNKRFVLALNGLGKYMNEAIGILVMVSVGESETPPRVR